MLLFTLSLLFHLSRIFVASGASCDCSSVVIPVHVDVLVPQDPTDPFAGLKSNASSLRRVDDTFNISGTFCQPNTVSNSNNSDVIQLLVHGFTYDGQYWSPPVEEFRNYSYAAFSCERGLSSLAVDCLGVGLSSRPVNASDVQYPTSSGALSEVARHLKNASIVPGLQPFKKVIGIGHSAGSAMLTFGAIVEGAQSPFDGLVLTGLLINEPGSPPALPLTPARDDTPLRWSALDPAYVTTSNRSLFYPADPNSFSPRMRVFDNFTKDVGPMATLLQGATSSLPAQFAGPVAKVVGSEDQLFCAGTGRCGDVAALTAAERAVWPAAKSFDVVVAPGSGHDLNLDFMADGPFGTFVGFVEQFSDA
ncbi:Alpha/beta hydrolase family-domain-containing protein [Mycena polygramma]|nr:Alpha/beta hydrolase family-domain-containing protein [Mycena polygramma]